MKKFLFLFFFLLFSLACSLIPLAYQPVISLHSSEIHRPKASEMENSTEFTSCFLISRFLIKNKQTTTTKNKQKNKSQHRLLLYISAFWSLQPGSGKGRDVWPCPACLDKLLPSSPLQLLTSMLMLLNV